MCGLNLRLHDVLGQRSVNVGLFVIVGVHTRRCVSMIVRVCTFVCPYCPLTAPQQEVSGYQRGEGEFLLRCDRPCGEYAFR